MRTGDADVREAEKTNGGETRPPPPLTAETVGANSLDAADTGEPVRPTAVLGDAKNGNALMPVVPARCGSGEAKNAKLPPSLEPVRAGFGEANNSKAPVPLEPLVPGDNDGWGAKTPHPPLAVEPMGFSGRSSEAKKAKAPLPLEPAGVNCCSGKAKNAKLPLLPPPFPPVVASADEKTLAVHPVLAAGEGADAGAEKGGSSSSIFLRGE